MSTARFRIKEHVLPTSHIREYPRGVVDDQEVVLNLAVKQYTPLEAKYEDEGDVTIIGAHANGFPKVTMYYILGFQQTHAYDIRNYTSLYGMIYTNV